MMIDTNYVSLAEVDENIRHYYAEDTRERVVGYTEEGESSPIIEPYTVVVLNQPDKVTYQDVEQRRSERKSWESVIKPELERAIAWEDFNVNHNQYLDWLDALALWEKGQPTEPVWDEEQQEYVETVIPEPERPVIDMADRRAVYHSLVQSHERDQWVPTEEIIIEVDDEAYTIAERSVGASDEAWAEFEANPSPEYVKYLKLKGIEFEGVMCSATKVDYWGLGVAFEGIKAGLSTKWNFENGNTLVLTPDNIDAFKAVWLPFRMSFFDTDFE